MKSRRPQPLRIALAEDDRDERSALQKAFEAEGFEVIALDDGSELRDYLRGPSPSPEAIVSDLEQLGAGGLEALQAARARGWPALIVVITSEPASVYRAGVAALGNALLLSRPIKVAHLARAIHELAETIGL